MDWFDISKNCPECDKRYYDRLGACPFCGYDNRKVKV